MLLVITKSLVDVNPGYGKHLTNNCLELQRGQVTAIKKRKGNWGNTEKLRK